MGEDNEDMIDQREPREEKMRDGRDKKDRPSTTDRNKAEVSFDVGRSFENPPSWVSPITLDRTQYLMR